MKINQADRIITFDKEMGNDAQSATLALVSGPGGRKVNIRKPTFDYGPRDRFAIPEWNLVDIGVIEDVESYVRQAFQKKTALMFKEGEDFKGKNSETIKYIKRRLQQIEHVSKVCWRQLLRETGYALISRSNHFWVKVRKASASGGRTIAGIQPVAGYFSLGAETVKIKKNKSGKITKYRQEMPDGRFREYSPRDVIHFSAYKKPGFSFGTPQIIPVKEDIRALRRIEENVELLIYQTLFPIFQYKVGTENKPAGDIRLPDGTLVSEVEFVRGQICDMPAEGGIVTPERHEIEFIGAEGKSLRAKEYLDYFKQRVLSGLGMSGVDIGEGNTANRATADSMSKAMIDSVKDFQDIMQEIVNKEVIKDLLLESAFNFDVLASENNVEFEFKEIDIEEQLKKNTNAQVLYNGNIIDVDEARSIADHEPVTEEQEQQMFSRRVTIPELQVQIDGNMDIAKIGAAAKAATASSAGNAAAKSAKNSNAPTNQTGTKTGPQKSRLDFFNIKDGHVSHMTRMLKSDITKHVNKQVINRNWINTLFEMGRDQAVKKYLQIARKEFVKGLKDSAVAPEKMEKLITFNFQEVKDSTEHFINKYARDLNGSVQNTIDRQVGSGATRKELTDAVLEAFDKLKFRGDFIDSTERMRAYNFGKAVGLRDRGFSRAKINKNPDCDKCQEAPDEVNLLDLNIFSVPPFHPNSGATVAEGIE